MLKVECLSISVAIVALTSPISVMAQVLPGKVVAHQKISDGIGGFPAALLADGDLFGSSLTQIGDLNGDTVPELVVGAPTRNALKGAIFVLFLDDAGMVISPPVEIGEADLGKPGLAAQDRFGNSVAWLGDLDGDGGTAGALAVGAPGDNDGPGGGGSFGAVWVLFLNADGTIDDTKTQRISHSNDMGDIDFGDADEFGTSLAALGDLDGMNAEVDLAVGVPNDDDDGTSGITSNVGAVWIVFLHGPKTLPTDPEPGTVESAQKISGQSGQFDGVLSDGDSFGHAVAAVDVDGVGVTDLAVGALNDDGGGLNQGAVWILLLDPAGDGTVQDEQKINDIEGGLDCSLDPGDLFGTSLASLGDFDLDGVDDLAVGVREDDDGDPDAGAVWILFLNDDGTAKAARKISDTEGTFPGQLDADDQFGSGLAFLGPFDDEGVGDLAVGARRDDDGGTDRGAVWVLFLDNGELGVWEDLGQQLPTPAGSPVLDGDGTLVAGCPITLSLTTAPMNKVAYLVIGLSELSAPFGGGTLVPEPDFLFILFTGLSGSIPLSLEMPAGAPSDFTFYLQYWIDDPTGPAGWAASNALSATTPE